VHGDGGTLGLATPEDLNQDDNDGHAVRETQK
jgi:hypothetical protein